MNAKLIAKELREHAPFTAMGTATGILILVAFSLLRVDAAVSARLFWLLHPLHVLMSALVTAAMYIRHRNRSLVGLILVGYLGSVGIATLSDSLIPYVGEALLQMERSKVHLGFIEKWWLVNPLAITGIAIALFRPRTRLAHSGHVLLSTWASLFHLTMASDSPLTFAGLTIVAVFLFLAVWVPCCTSDIVFPLLFARDARHRAGEGASVPAEDHRRPSKGADQAAIGRGNPA